MKYVCLRLLVLLLLSGPICDPGHRISCSRILVSVFDFASVSVIVVIPRTLCKVYSTFSRGRMLMFSHNDAINNLHNDCEAVVPVDVS